MKLYNEGRDIELRENNSEAYPTGSVHDTFNYGQITVMGQVDKYHERKNGVKNYFYFIVQFEDGTKVDTIAVAIQKGRVKNPNQPSMCSKGFEGQGVYSFEEHKKEHQIWADIITRCHSEAFKKKFPTYKTCSLDSQWLNFQIFCKDIENLEGYSFWKKGTKLKRNNYDIDKDVKIKGNKRYAKEMCSFVSHKENMGRHNKKQVYTGLTYIATRLSDGYKEEFQVLRYFGEKYNFNGRDISACLSGKQKTAHGWKFKIKEGTQK